MYSTLVIVFQLLMISRSESDRKIMCTLIVISLNRQQYLKESLNFFESKRVNLELMRIF
jgi:hypothetical protein